MNTSPDVSASSPPEAAAAASTAPQTMAGQLASEGEEKLSIRALLDAGMHFGHQTKRWNPKMRQYIYGSRNGVHIVDLQQTLPLFQAACKKVTEVVANGYPVLFVGTKKQAQEVMREEATRCGMFYMTNRWLGGTLTNFRTVRGSIEKLKSIETMIDTEGDKLLKKERLRMQRLAEKLERNLGGIKDMADLPGLIVLVDPRNERIGVAEANRLGIPIVALTDTNCDPDVVDYVVPGNDDAIRAVRLFASAIADACLLGKRVGRDRAVIAKDREPRGDVSPEPIRVSSGGDGPKVEVVSRRGTTHTSPEAVASPEEESK